MVRWMVWRCPPVLHLRPSTLIDQFGHVECHHLLPGPARPFLCERQSLAGRWLFKPCQIRRVMMSSVPATFVCSTLTITATKHPAHWTHVLLFSLLSSFKTNKINSHLFFSCTSSLLLLRTRLLIYFPSVPFSCSFLAS